MTRTRNLARDLATLRRVSQRLSEAMPEALEQAEQAAASRRELQALALAVEKGLRRILCSEIREAAEMLTGALSQARTYLTGSAELGSDLGQVGVGVELALEARDSELLPVPQKR